jgi:hypothetical protein
MPASGVSAVFTLAEGGFIENMNVGLTAANSANHVPVAKNDSNAAGKSGKTSGNLLVNDTDSDGNDLLSLIDADAFSALGAQITIRPDGTYDYDPRTSSLIQSLAPGSVRQDYFFYTIADSNGGSAVGMVFVRAQGTPINQIEGTAGVDVVRIARNPTDNSLVDLFLNNSTVTPDYSTSLPDLEQSPDLRQWQIIGSEGADRLIVDFSYDNPLPSAGIFFNGKSLSTGCTIVVKDSLHSRQVTLTGSQISVSGIAPVISYSNIAYYELELGESGNQLTIDHAAWTIDKENAIPAGTKVTVNGGFLDFNGYLDALGDLTLMDGGKVSATAIHNGATQVVSGTLIAGSIICDSLTIGTPHVVKTRTWDGGGANNNWSTAANWQDDEAPLPGDNLVFPPLADPLTSINDSPPGTFFGSITVSGNNHHFQNGVASLSNIQVASGTLTTASIICDTLSIGSPPGIAANSTMTNAIASPRAQTVEASKTVFAEPLNSSTIGRVENSSVTYELKSPNNQLPLDQTTAISGVHNSSILSSRVVAVSQIIASIFSGNQAISRPTITFSFPLPEKLIEQESKLRTVELLASETFQEKTVADVCLTTRSDSQPTFSSRSLLSNRITDFVFKEFRIPLAETKTRPPLALTNNLHARRLALDLLTAEDDQNLFIKREVASRLFVKHWRKPERFAAAETDDFCRLMADDEE